MPENLDPPFLVEFKENPSFLGRTDDLERLHAALQSSGAVGEHEAVGIVPARVTRMGGICKTQLAVKYVYQYRHHYPDGTYWLNAARPLYGEKGTLR